jgi:uncharacterized membrane-anchored protein YitT (DUF2179 family)
MAPSPNESLRNDIFSYFQVATGVIVAGFGLGSFLIPNHFVDGGATGVAMLLSNLTNMSLAWWIVVVNLPFIFLGYRTLGREFGIKSGSAIFALAAVLLLVRFPVATHDKVLGAIFGGSFVGAGVGLAMRGGAVLDGTEVLALLLSKRTFATVGEIILMLNGIIFGIAGFSMGLEPALYSMLTYFAATRTIDYLLHGLEAYVGVLVVSSEHGKIREAILSMLGRGVTILKGAGGFSESEQPVLFCVVTRLELHRLQEIAKEIDSQSFLTVLPVLDVNGGTVKRRPFH